MLLPQKLVNMGVFLTFAAISINSSNAQEVGFAKSRRLPEADIGADCGEISL